MEDRAQGGEAGPDDPEGGLDRSPEHDPVVVDLCYELVRGLKWRRKRRLEGDLVGRGCNGCSHEKSKSARSRNLKYETVRPIPATTTLDTTN